jgi:hypothetical protein
MSLLNRGHRGQLRERYIGEGKLRELMAKAAGMEKNANLLEAAKIWESAIPFINYGRPGAKAKEDYITKRIHYCKVWGLRLKPLN